MFFQICRIFDNKTETDPPLCLSFSLPLSGGSLTTVAPFGLARKSLDFLSNYITQHFRDRWVLGSKFNQVCPNAVAAVIH